MMHSMQTKGNMTEISRIDELAPVVEREAPPVVPPIPVAEEDTSRIVNISQQKLDRLISSAMGRSAATTRAELAAANQTITDLQVQLRAANPDSTVADCLNAELAVARAEIVSIKASAAQQATASHLEQLAARANFLDPALTRQILASQVQRNPDGSYSVLDSHGAVRVNAEGAPISVEQLIEETAADKPFLVKGQWKSGGGGTSSSGSSFRTSVADKPLEFYFGPKSNAAAVNALSIQKPDEYRRKRAEAVRAGILVS
jgi:hypothetical protein